jgi:hypothetical protein
MYFNVCTSSSDLNNEYFQFMHFQITKKKKNKEKKNTTFSHIYLHWVMYYGMFAIRFNLVLPPLLDHERYI